MSRGANLCVCCNSGQSFGELALTQGKDLRTASVVAHTKTEVSRPLPACLSACVWRIV